MNILITGGAGFVGFHLVSKLLSSGHKVTVLDDLSTGQSQNVEPFKSNASYTFVKDSVLNRPVLHDLVSQADLVYHLAAAVGVRLIVEEPVKTISINIAGTENVLSAAADECKKVVLSSTSEIYGKSENIPFSEEGDMVLGPTINSRWSYACSKAIDEFLALAYWKEQKIPVTIARLFNTIGPRQVGQYGMVVPRFVNQALKNEPITVYGDGTQSRVFCYVEDVVGALSEMGIQDKANGEIFNLGGREEISIADLAQQIKKLANSSSEIKFVPYDEAYQKGFEDLVRRVPKIEKANKILGFDPKVSLENALKKIIEYYTETVN